MKIAIGENTHFKVMVSTEPFSNFPIQLRPDDKIDESVFLIQLSIDEAKSLIAALAVSIESLTISQ